MTQYHSFHIVENSPWPLLASLGAGLMVFNMVGLFHSGMKAPGVVSLVLVSLVAFQWWRDVSREATLQGLHTSEVELNMRWGMALFIVSEVLFFFSFFWAYFHMMLSPSLDVGLVWPPIGVLEFNPLLVPLLNTTILLSSGLTVTWAHHAIMMSNYKEAVLGLGLTVGLGVYFTLIQGYEYMTSYFSLSDSVYGSCFFVATGFHGLHVLIGSTFLLTCLVRLYLGQFSSAHHFGLEAAAWYWHFVDVVWIFLFLSVYWWGS